MAMRLMQMALTDTSLLSLTELTSCLLSSLVFLVINLVHLLQHWSKCPYSLHLLLKALQLLVTHLFGPAQNRYEFFNRCLQSFP